jgi:hypothetical protein
MSLRQRVRRLRDRDDAGVTVSEMAITLLLLGIVLSITFAAMSSTQNALRGSDERTGNLAEARLILEQSTRDLRTATRPDSVSSPFTLAKPNELTFAAYLDATGNKSTVHFYIDNTSRLIEEVTDVNGVKKVRMVGSYVVNGASTTAPPFSFFDGSGATLAVDSSCNCLAAADLLKVDSVGLMFQVRHSTGLKVAPTTLVNRVRLPNVDYNPLTTGGP